MKIEKISENQIKCTLNKSDLASRQIKAGELAYGTEKAKLLFRDMMQQAAVEFGFHAEDLPLMIEAIPVSGDSIILIITKVEDPEELDTRFSNFTPDTSLNVDDGDLMEEEYLENMEYLEDENDDDSETNTMSLIDIFKEVKDRLENLSAGRDFIPLSEMIDAAKQSKQSKENHENSVEKETRLVHIYSFDNLNILLKLSKCIADIYHGTNSLYKSKENRYYLILDKSSHSLPEFMAICSMISEFGTAENAAPVNEAYYKEHFEKVISKNALQKLHLINTGGCNNGTDI